MVVGRYSSRAIDEHGEEIDRYLVLSRHPHFSVGNSKVDEKPYWIDVADVDILDSTDNVCNR